jgi:hypothetical protein
MPAKYDSGHAEINDCSKLDIARCLWLNVCGWLLLLSLLCNKTIAQGK